MTTLLPRVPAPVFTEMEAHRSFEHNHELVQTVWTTCAPMATPLGYTAHMLWLPVTEVLGNEHSGL